MLSTKITHLSRLQDLEEGSISFAPWGAMDPELNDALSAAISDFLLDWCAIAPGVEATADGLYASYQRWCSAGKLPALDVHGFSDAIAELGFERRLDDAGRLLWLGICPLATVVNAEVD
jgi:hypothetical protein